jgi:hypothetical protein
MTFKPEALDQPYVGWQDIETSPSFQNADNERKMKMFDGWADYSMAYLDKRKKEAPESDLLKFQEGEKKQAEWISQNRPEFLKRYTIEGMLAEEEDANTILETLKNEEELRSKGFSDESISKAKKRVEDFLLPQMEAFHNNLDGLASPSQGYTQDQLRQKIWEEPNLGDHLRNIENGLANGFASVLLGAVQGLATGLSLTDMTKQSPAERNWADSVADWARDYKELFAGQLPPDPRMHWATNAAVSGVGQAPAQLLTAPVLPVQVAANFGQMFAEDSDSFFEAEKKDEFERRKAAGILPDETPYSEFEKMLSADEIEELRASASWKAIPSSLINTVGETISEKIALKGVPWTKIPYGKTIQKRIDNLRKANPKMALGSRIFGNVAGASVSESLTEGGQGIISGTAKAIAYESVDAGEAFKDIGPNMVGGAAGGTAMSLAPSVTRAFREQALFEDANAVVDGTAKSIVGLKLQLQAAENEFGADSTQARTLQKAIQSQEDEAHYHLSLIGGNFDEARAQRGKTMADAKNSFRTQLAQWIKDNQVGDYASARDIEKERQGKLAELKSNVSRMREGILRNGDSTGGTLDAGVAQWEANEAARIDKETEERRTKAEATLAEFVGSVGQDGPGKAAFARVLVGQMSPDFTYSKDFQDDATVTEIYDAIQQGLITDKTNLAEWLQAPAAQTAPAAPAAMSTAEVQALEDAAYQEASAWDMSVKQQGRHRSDEWFEGGNANLEANQGYADSEAAGGMQLQAHGMAKEATLSGGVKNLLGLLRNGLNPTRRGGRLDTANLVAPVGGGLVGATASGTAYRDGPFTLVARPGQDLSGDLSGLGAVVINQANAAQADSIRKAIHAVRPDVIVGTASELGAITKQLLSQPGVPTPSTPATQGLLTTGQRRDAIKEARINLRDASPEAQSEFVDLTNDIEFWNAILNDKDSTEQDKAEAMERLPALDNALLELATNPNQVSSQSPNPNDQNQTANQSTVPTQEVPSTGAASEGAGAGVQTIRATNADGTQANYSQEDYAEESRRIVVALEKGEMSPEEVLQNVESVRMEIEAAPDLTPEQKAQWFAPFQNIPALIEQRARAARTPEQAPTQTQAAAPAAQSTEQITDEIGQAANSLTEEEFVKWAKDSGYAIGDNPTMARLTYRSRRTPEPTAPVAETPAVTEQQQQAPAEESTVTNQPSPARLNGVSGDVVRTETGETVFRSAIDGAETVLRVKESSIDKDPAALTAEDFESGDGTPLVSEANKQFSVLPQNDRPVRPFFRSQTQTTEGGETNEQSQTQEGRQEGSSPEGQNQAQGRGQSQEVNQTPLSGSTEGGAAPDIAAITADVQANPDQHRSKQGNRKLVSREAAVTILSQLPETLTNKDVATLAKDSGMSGVNFRKLAALRGDPNAVGSILNGDMDAELGLFDRATAAPQSEAQQAPANTETESPFANQSQVDRWVNDAFAAIEAKVGSMPMAKLNLAPFREKLATDEGRAEIREKLGQMFNTVARNLKIADPVVREEAIEKIFRGTQSQTGEGLTSNVLADILTNLQKTGDPFVVQTKNGEVGYSAWLKHRNKQDEFVKAQGKRDMTETLVENEGAPTSASQGVQEEEGEGTGPAFGEGDPDLEAGRAEAKSMQREAVQKAYDRIARSIAGQYGLDRDSVKAAIAKYFSKNRGVALDYEGLGWATPSRSKVDKATAALAGAMPDIEQQLIKELTKAIKSAAAEANRLGLLKSDAVETSGTPTLERIIELGVIEEIQNPDFYNAIKEAREKNSPDALVPLLAQFSQNDIVNLQVVTGIVLNNGSRITDKAQLASLNKADMQEVLDSNLLPPHLRQTLQALVDLSGEDGLGLVRNSKNEGFRRLAELYTEQIGNRAPVEVVFNFGLNPAVTGQGFWASGSNRVHISPFLTREKGLMEATILHEVMHPIWDRKITDFLDGRMDRLTANEQKSIAELQQLFNLAKAEAATQLAQLDSTAGPETRRIMERNLLGAQDLREFLNEALNHKPFQDFLNGIKDPNAAGKTSVWRSILNKILELIRGGKVSLDSVLQRSFELSVDLANYTERQMPIEQRNPKQIDYFRQLERQKGRPLTPSEIELAAVDFELQYPQPRMAETRQEANRLAGEILSTGELANYNHELRTEGQSVLASEMVVTDQQVYEAIKANGGITIDVWTAGQPGTGIVVAPFKETETQIPLNEFKPDDVRAFLRKFRPLLEVPGMHLGGWISDDTVYLDVSIVTEDEVTATLLAEDGNQLAAFNIGTGEFPTTPELVARNSGALAERRSDPDFQNLARTLQQAFGRTMGGLRGESDSDVSGKGALPEIGIIEALTGEPATQDEINRIAESAPRPELGGDFGQPQANSEDLQGSGRSGVPDVSGGLGGVGTVGGTLQSRLQNEPALQVSSIQGSRVEGKLAGAPFYRVSSPEVYSQILSDFVDANPLGGQVTKKTPEQLAGAELYLSENGEAGFAVYPTGEIGSLFAKPGAGKLSVELLRALRKQTFSFPVYAASFNTRLVPLYSRMAGMVPVARLPWESAGRTDGVDWDSNSAEFRDFENGKPSVVIWAFNPEKAVSLDAEDILSQFPQVAPSYKEATDLAKNRSVVIKESRAVPGPDEKFAGYTQVVDYIESEYGPKVKALKSWINDSVLAHTASYVSNGRHGQHYVQYNPLRMLSYTRSQVDAVMREEMIHAASGFVLMKKGIEYSKFYEDLGSSLSSAQRSKLKAVYTSTDGLRSVGAEYFRAAIQKLLYGTITETEMRETPMKKIVALLRDFVKFFKRGLIDPVVQDVYEDTVRILQKIDKKNAKQDPKLAVLNSETVPSVVSAADQIEAVGYPKEISEAVASKAYKLFKLAGISESDFALQTASDEVAVFGGWNRIIARQNEEDIRQWTFSIDRGLSRPEVVDRFDSLPELEKRLSVSETPVLNSVAVSYKDAVDKSLRNVIDKAVAEPAQAAFLKSEEFAKAKDTLLNFIQTPELSRAKARGGRTVNLNSPDDSTARKLEKATGQWWDGARQMLEARAIHALTESDRLTPNADKIASAPMVPQTLRQADFVARTDFEGRPFLVFAKLYTDPDSPTGVRWHFVEAREDTGAFETQYSTTDPQRGRAMAAKVIGIGDATPKKKKTPTEAGYAQETAGETPSPLQGIGPDVSSSQGEVLDNTNVESVQNKILDEIESLTDKQNRLAQSGDYKGAEAVGNQIKELTAQFDGLESAPVLGPEAVLSEIDRVLDLPDRPEAVETSPFEGGKVRSIAKIFAKSLGAKNRIEFGDVEGKRAAAKISKAGDRIFEVLRRAAYEFPNFASWYESRLKMALQIFTELDPDVANKNNQSALLVALAITSNGADVATQTEDAWDVYKFWKQSGNLAGAPEKRGAMRGGEVEEKLALADALAQKIGDYEKLGEFLNRKGTVAELRAALQNELGLTKKESEKITNGELVDEVVPFSLIFGAKLGSFFNNMSGDFSTITMDRWFMRTFGRAMGTQLSTIAKENIEAKKARLEKALEGYTAELLKNAGIENAEADLEKTAAALSQSLLKKAGVREGTKDLVKISVALADYFVSSENRKGLSETEHEIRRAANALFKVGDGLELNEAPDGGSHRRWIRAVMADAINKFNQQTDKPLVPAEAQALLWYYEKVIHETYGSRQKDASPDYGSGANRLYIRERGTQSPSYRDSDGIKRRSGGGRSAAFGGNQALSATDQSPEESVRQSAPVVPFQGNTLPGFNPSVSTRADARKTSALAAVLSDPEYRSVQAALNDKRYFASREGETLKKANEFIDANGGDLQKAFINTSTAYGLTPEQAIIVRGLALKRAQAAANAARAEMANPNTPAKRMVNLQFVEQHYSDMAESFAESLMENASLTGQGLRAYGLLADALAPKTWANSYKKAAQKTQTEKFNKDRVLKAMMERIKVARQLAANSTTDRMQKALAMAAKRFMPERTTDAEIDAYEKFARLMASELSVREEVMQAAVEQTVVSGIETIRRALAPGESIPDSFLRDWENRLRKIATDQINAVIEQRLQGGQVDPETRELTEQEKEAEQKQKLLDMWREFSDYPLAEIVFNLARSTIVASDSPYANLVRKAQFDPERIKNLRKAVQSSINTAAEVRKSVADRRMSVETLKLRLAEANPSLNEAQLGRLAAAVEAVYNEEVARATRAAMDKLVREYSDGLFTKKTAKTVGQPDFLQRLLPMVNMGVFSDEAVYNAVADKLRLPVWNPDTAAEIEAKANELQALPEGSLQRQEAAQRLMSDILKANIKEARGAGRWGPIMQISSALWSAGILSGPPTQIINTGMTTVSVFSQNIFEATGYWAAATANGATQEQARAYYGDMLRAWLFAAGKDANNTSLRAVNEVYNAVTKGQTRFKSEKLENMSPLELFKFHPRVAAPANKMMDALMDGEGKTAFKEALKMAAGVPITMGQRIVTGDVKGAAKDYAATMKLVGRLMLAADGVNSYAAMASKEMMMRRFLAQEEKMSPQEIDRVMREAQQGGNEAVRDAAIAQAEDEAQRGDFGPVGSKSHEIQKARRIEQLIEQQTYDADTINAGREFAAVATFNNDPYGAIGWMMDTLFAGPTKVLGIATKPINPFPKTVSNLVNAAIDFSPYGVLRAEGWNLGTALAQSKHYPKQFYKEAPERGTPEYYALYSRAAFGTAATGILAMMIVSAVKDRKEKKEEPWFEIHGAGPRSPEARKQWAASGAKKFSLKVGRGDGALQLNYTDWPVLNLVLGVLGTFYDEAVYGDLQTDPWDWLTQTLRSVALVTLNRNFLGGAANLFEILSANTPDELASVKMKQFFSSYPTGFTRPSFVRWAETIATGTRQETSTTEGWLLSMTPVVSAFRDRPALNLLGEPIEISAWDATAGRVATLQQTHPVLTPLTNAQLWINPPKAYPVYDPNSPTLVRKMTKAEFYDYSKAYGEALRMLIPPNKAESLANLAKTAPNTAQNILNTISNSAANAAKGKGAQEGLIRGKELKGP